MSDDTRTPVGRFDAITKPDILRDCIICFESLGIGDVPTIVSLAPADAAEAKREREGRAYNAVGGVAHERCAWPGEGR